MNEVDYFKALLQGQAPWFDQALTQYLRSVGATQALIRIHQIHASPRAYFGTRLVPLVCELGDILITHEKQGQKSRAALIQTKNGSTLHGTYDDECARLLQNPGLPKDNLDTSTKKQYCLYASWQPFRLTKSKTPFNISDTAQPKSFFMYLKNVQQNQVQPFPTVVIDGSRLGVPHVPNGWVGLLRGMHLQNLGSEFDTRDAEAPMTDWHKLIRFLITRKTKSKLSQTYTAKKDVSREGLSFAVYEAPSFFTRIRHAVLEALGRKPMVIIQITVDSAE